MTAQSFVADMLHAAGRIAADRPGVTDQRLLDDNKALSLELARLRLRIHELERMADTDPMLPVYNRRAFMREVRRAQGVMSRYGILSSIIYFDLDGFKAVNDRYGHAVGDTLLERVAGVLDRGVRDCDMVARLGGDEFGVLLFKSGVDVARAKAGVLACRISEIGLDHPDGPVRVSASWGTAPCEPDDTPDIVLDRADRAMYLDKKLG